MVQYLNTAQIEARASQRNNVEPWVEALSHAAGPHVAVVVDDQGNLLDALHWDHERGAPVESVPANGWVS